MEEKIFSDEEILKMFNNGKTKETAFRIIVKQFSKQLYSRIRAIVNTHEETDDILQNTFVKAWRALDKFRLEANLYTWLFKIASNEAFSHIRSSQKNTAMSLDDDTLHLDICSIGSLQGDNSEQIEKKLLSAVSQLPKKQRLVFEMKYFKEMKYDDMAQELQTSVGALKASYHHAVKKIEKILTE
ncbi:MAG: sigma-70 family RNA polymerase sigma factor [Bacteroidales bacterium]|nr:sigma-70 family RNA polymerase sigma factor [Bacteroidales bacterium]